MSDIGPKRTLLNRMDRITIEALENWTPRSNKGGGRVSYQVSSRQAVVRQRRRDNVPRERCNDACLFSSNEIVKSRPAFAQGSDPFLQVGGEGEKGQIAGATAIRRRLRPGS